MKNIFNLAAPLLVAAALCLPAFAQTEDAAGAPNGDGQELSAGGGDQPAAEPAKPAKKKAGKKKTNSKGQLSLDDINPNDTSGAEAAEKAEAKKAAKKPAKKKKKPAKPVSEYKFSAAESVPTYKFDKKANPIVKPSKKKKDAKKGAADKKGAPAPKLKPSKSIGEEEKSSDPMQGMMQGMMQGAGNGN